MPRAIWKGAINFGLVTIPVGMYTATDNKTPKFKQLRKTDHSPIRYKRVAEADGEEVEWDDIVKGYEFEKDRFVVFTDEELNSANPEGNKLVDVIQFVDEEEIERLARAAVRRMRMEPAAGVGRSRLVQENRLAEPGDGAQPVAVHVVQAHRHLAHRCQPLYVCGI